MQQYSFKNGMHEALNCIFIYTGTSPAPHLFDDLMSLRESEDKTAQRTYPYITYKRQIKDKCKT